MKVLIDIPKESYDFAKECKHNGTSKYNWGLSHNDVVFMIANGTPILDNATNGDMIKAMFPDCKDWKAKLEDNDGEVYEVHFVQLLNNMTVNKYEESWWNAPYKRGSENEVN